MSITGVRIALFRIGSRSVAHCVDDASAAPPAAGTSGSVTAPELGEDLDDSGDLPRKSPSTGGGVTRLLGRSLRQDPTLRPRARRTPDGDEQAPLRDELAGGEHEEDSTLPAASADLQNEGYVPSRGGDRRAPFQILDAEVG
jgi:hypothetical protein